MEYVVIGICIAVIAALIFLKRKPKAVAGEVLSPPAVSEFDRHHFLICRIPECAPPLGQKRSFAKRKAPFYTGYAAVYA